MTGNLDVTVHNHTGKDYLNAEIELEGYLQLQIGTADQSNRIRSKTGFLLCSFRSCYFNNQFIETPVTPSYFHINFKLAS